MCAAAQSVRAAPGYRLSMAEFIVVEVNEERRLIALLDRAGRYHVAFATSGMPPISTYVRGFNPERGFGLLVNVQSGQVYRIVFESVDCRQEKALELLHGRSAEAPASHTPASHTPASHSPAAASPLAPFRANRSKDTWDRLEPERRADRSS
jgi:hypothetical protein